MTKSATSTSNQDVYLWSCNYPSAADCSRDRKRVIISLSGPGFSAGLADVRLDDCEVYIYHFANRTNGLRYGVGGIEGGVLDSTSTNVRTYHAVGWQRSGADVHDGCATCSTDDDDTGATGDSDPDRDVIMDFATP